MTEELKAPFPYFGGKSIVAADVWQRLGDPPNYVEPFFGSGAVLLARPHWTPERNWIETANDASGFIPNFWRALQADPDAVAAHANHPVFECDLHARHYWLVQRKESLAPRLEGDPDWYDAKIAGWWAWGMSCWIGSGFCSGAGPWHVEDGLLVRTEANGQGVKRQLPHLSKGQGVNRKLPHLGDAGRGVNSGNGRSGLYAWMQALAARLQRVRVCCGDWSRIMGPSVTFKHGLTGVFLDPPYSAEAGRNNELYEVESATVAHDVRAWCLENGDNPLLRIALCGYDGEGHEELEAQGWEAFAWKAAGGYGSQGEGAGRDNAHREVIWFSPHCLKPQRQASIFDLMEAA